MTPFIAAADVRRLAHTLPLNDLLARAATLRDDIHGARVSWSRKVFIPLTRLCRDRCHYCTFATSPRRAGSAYLSRDQVLAIARAGERAGCREALFTLGDKPEARYRQAREALDAMGYGSTIDYLTAMCRAVLEETSLLPHVNPGVMTEAEIAQLRAVSVSQGIMLESAAARLCERGGPHYGSPDKDPAVRLATIEAAGRLRVPFTSGILIGIGETRDERIDALLALRESHARHGHLQEVIVQNFRAKEGTAMQGSAEPAFDELAWTVAVARIAFGGQMNIQVPPNLSPLEYERALAAGVNDWGGVSPVTIDHVNPEAPWPQVEALGHATARGGKVLVERLAIYPAFALAADRWLSPELAPRVRGLIDADGLARCDDWSPGRADVAIPLLLERGLVAPNRLASDLAAPAAAAPLASVRVQASIERIVDRASAGDRLGEGDITRLFQARGDEISLIAAAADRLRQAMNGDRVGYVVNRNINYTNVCTYRCRFCAFSKGRGAASAQLRGEPYDLSIAEIQRRVDEAWQRGATEVCMQGGIHPGYTGQTYLAIARAVKEVQPGMHVHAFSPLEITQGAATLGLPLTVYLERLREAGLGSLPGTAAEILDDEVRRMICPDKIDTAQWCAVMEAAATVGLRATATIMYGHVESPRHWARHLLVVRDLQTRCGVFTEFVPLPFVHMEAPMSLRGQARHGPTWREALLMHAVARLALHPVLPSVQASWVKLGRDGAAACLAAGANDLGGTLMNESISRAAGTEHGQELPPAEMDALIISSGRVPWQRSTLQGMPDAAQVTRSYAAAELEPIVLERAGRLPRIPSGVPA